MKTKFTNSNFYNFTVLLAVLGLLALPVGCTHLAQVGEGSTTTTKEKVHEEDVDWTLAKNETEEEDEVDWTLAKNTESEEDETDWTLA